MLYGSTKRLNVGQMTDALKARRDRDAWTVMITFAEEQGTYLIEGI